MIGSLENLGTRERARSAPALTAFAPECYLRAMRSNPQSRARCALSIGAALLVLVGTLFASVSVCFAMPERHACCTEGVSDADGAACEVSAPATCCEPAAPPSPPSRPAPAAAVAFDAPLAVLPSHAPAVAPRLRLARGAAPLPRTALLLRAAVLRL
jgi:hypothetical protein